MLQANELRIGNWVNFYYSISGETKPLQINWEWFGSEADQKDSSSIPLTPELLVKCGFVYNGFLHILGVFKIGYDRVDFVEQKMTVKINKCICVKIKYLHQLQNLYFALTGEELNIEL